MELFQVSQWSALNSKSEYRKSKQIRILKWSKFKTVLNIRIYDFEFVSCIQRLSATLGFKDLGRSFKIKALFWTVVKPIFDLCQFMLGDISQVDFLWYEASNQPDCVLDGSLLVTAVGFTKI